MILKFGGGVEHLTTDKYETPNVKR